MNQIGHGKIAARSIGTLLLIVGAVTLIDFAIHLQQSKQVFSEMGWGSYAPLEEAQDSGPINSFLHDTYYVISPTVSPFASGLFVLIGIVLLIFSTTLGRLIAGGGRCEKDVPPES